MSRAEKLLARFLSKPKDFSYDELKSLLQYLGYYDSNSGRTSGSRVAFINPTTIPKHIIRLHKPHPSPILKKYQMNYIEQELRGKGFIK